MKRDVSYKTKAEQKLAECMEEVANANFELREALKRITELETFACAVFLTLAQVNGPMAEKIKGDSKWKSTLEHCGILERTDHLANLRAETGRRESATPS